MLDSNYVLLLNSRPDKGFDLILEVAAICSDINFVCVASQSDRSHAEGRVRQARLHNVTIIDRTDNTNELYSNCRCVAVPSYRFVETFSRVCIEAHRFGKPVIGSDVGNVPFLLSDSGVVLSENAREWADAIFRIYCDDAYYRELRRAAYLNSEKYSQSSQRIDTHRQLHFAQQSILVGIGSGIGNMIHVGPMIRQISRWANARVDIVVNEDHSTSLFLLHDPAWVNTVHSLRNHILQKRYRLVFITHSFGPSKFRFNADTVIWTRDWDSFHPGHEYHETLYNLECARQLLGAPYEPEDLKAHYISELCVRPRKANRIGFHAGSKTGAWTSKRWPHFADLAQRLHREGFEVASFGIKDEFIEGTVDLTGGSIEQMARDMSTCEYFISNDSGLMNIANALRIPTIGIFGPTNWRTRGPMGDTSLSVVLQKSCAPCECLAHWHFDSGSCKCIGEVTIEEVYDAFCYLRGGSIDTEAAGAPRRFRPEAVRRQRSTSE